MKINAPPPGLIASRATPSKPSSRKGHYGYHNIGCHANPASNTRLDIRFGRTPNARFGTASDEEDALKDVGPVKLLRMAIVEASKKMDFKKYGAWSLKNISRNFVGLRETVHNLVDFSRTGNDMDFEARYNAFKDLKEKTGLYSCFPAGFDVFATLHPKLPNGDRNNCNFITYINGLFTSFNPILELMNPENGPASQKIHDMMDENGVAREAQFDSIGDMIRAMVACQGLLHESTTRDAVEILEECAPSTALFWFYKDFRHAREVNEKLVSKPHSELDFEEATNFNFYVPEYIKHLKEAENIIVPMAIRKMRTKEDLEVFVQLLKEMPLDALKEELLKEDYQPEFSASFYEMSKNPKLSNWMKDFLSTNGFDFGDGFVDDWFKFNRFRGSHHPNQEEPTNFPQSVETPATSAGSTPRGVEKTTSGFRVGSESLEDFMEKLAVRRDDPGFYVLTTENPESLRQVMNREMSSRQQQAKDFGVHKGVSFFTVENTEDYVKFANHLASDASNQNAENILLRLNTTDVLTLILTWEKVYSRYETRGGLPAGSNLIVIEGPDLYQQPKSRTWRDKVVEGNRAVHFTI